MRAFDLPEVETEIVAWWVFQVPAESQMKRRWRRKECQAVGKWGYGLVPMVC